MNHQPIRGTVFNSDRFEFTPTRGQAITRSFPVHMLPPQTPRTVIPASSRSHRFHRKSALVAHEGFIDPNRIGTILRQMRPLFPAPRAHFFFFESLFAASTFRCSWDALSFS